MDIFLLSGTRLEGRPAGATNRLYKNNRDGTFTDVTEKAGLNAVGWASGVCVGDYNNDGFEDLFCTYFGQNRLYRNNGDGTFTDVTKAAGLWNDRTAMGRRMQLPRLQPRRSSGSVRLQLCALLLRTRARAGRRTPTATGRAFLCAADRAGCRRGSTRCIATTATELSPTSAGKRASPRRRSRYGMTVVAADFDEDGWPDIYVACDSTPSLLFMNNHDGTFREEGVVRGVALSDDGAEQAGMGVGVGDYDLDGHLDLFKTHFADDANGLYHNDGQGKFRRCDPHVARGSGDALRRLGRGNR